MFKLTKYVHKQTLTFYAITLTIHRILFLATPLITAMFIDAVVDMALETAFFWGIASAIAFLFVQITNYFDDFFAGKLHTEAYSNIFNKIDDTLKFYDTKKSSLTDIEMHQQIGQNYEIIKNFIFMYPMLSVFYCITIVAILVISFIVSPLMSISMAIVVPFTFFASLYFGKKITSVAADNLNDMEEIRGFVSDQFYLSKEERFLTQKQMPKINELLDRYRKNMIKKVKVDSFFDNILTYGMLNGTILAITLLSGYLVFTNAITIGLLYVFTLYVSHLWSPIEFLAKYRKEYLSAKPALSAFDRFINLEKIDFSEDRLSELRLENFISLDTNGKPLHNAQNIHFQKGKLHIIAGENGRGKTTLVETILQLTNRYNGNVYFNGKSEFSSDLVYIPGEPYISKYGELKDCYDGSFGQKKLAQIELAIKTDKFVYIFDEPTNYLDSKNKIFVLERIRKLIEGGKVVIVITHDELLLREDSAVVYRLA
ncbi:MAG: ABC transporter ATP-binding protein/permease [Turicibacter sp.]|nr:ABC transporter ATP-binding protein/permease [Turicibacter sp.]